MNLTTTRSFFRNPLQSLSKSHIRSNTVYGVIIILAMFAFEAFNYGTTNYALKDLLGDLRFAGVPWATLMALAFCGIDFAGIARLITTNGREENPKSSWYLFGAWLLAGTFNAILTWWGVSIAISNHTTLSAALLSTQSLTKIIPIMVAIMVWIIRICIIGSLSSALEKINTPSRHTQTTARQNTSTPQRFNPNQERPAANLHRIVPSQPRPTGSVAASSRVEPTYHRFDSADQSTRSL